jgi:hypothetical protein
VVFRHGTSRELITKLPNIVTVAIAKNSDMVVR